MRDLAFGFFGNKKASARDVSFDLREVAMAFPTLLTWRSAVGSFVYSALLVPALAPLPVPLRGEPQARPASDSLGDRLPVGAAARLGTTRLRHDGLGGITGLRFSPDGSSSGGTVFVQTPTARTAIVVSWLTGSVNVAPSQ